MVGQSVVISSRLMHACLLKNNFCELSVTYVVCLVSTVNYEWCLPEAGCVAGLLKDTILGINEIQKKKLN